MLQDPMRCSLERFVPSELDPPPLLKKGHSPCDTPKRPLHYECCYLLLHFARGFILQRGSRKDREYLGNTPIAAKDG